MTSILAPILGAAMLFAVLGLTVWPSLIWIGASWLLCVFFSILNALYGERGIAWRTQWRWVLVGHGLALAAQVPLFILNPAVIWPGHPDDPSKVEMERWDSPERDETLLVGTWDEDNHWRILITGREDER